MSEIISKKNMRLKISVKDWRQAITEVGCLLESGGHTIADYTQEMIKAVETYGPYIVVAPGIALAHSRPAPSVLKTGLSLTTLAEPVNFGSEENDPVYIVLGLCAISNNDHLEMISQLVEFLDNEDNIELLKSSNNIQDIYSAINKVEQGD
ncbi:PTS sugar transporter subunit IIA [Buttiauxella sp. B2]|uniref:PTS sugar transporter subunit IIA n=1 Tax=Buttiauxella sp. B2 TaxID=2587812 RepID=UPI0011215011|nr:PTS sugar transporter subunit IIA [Buttiauxella sp. B2]TNV12483.1 PTS sugar transporter subunit IIA [Buttiauxella sp. B2]